MPLRFESLEHRQLLAVGPVITEFMADNANTLQDEDGAYSDWIEVYNPTDEPLSLAGYHLTDDDDVLDMWTFPDVTLPARGFLVVFASGNDRVDAGELHTNFRLSLDGEYLALVAPDAATIQTEFFPAYPAQHEDVSYGVEQGTNGVTLLGPETVGRALVPTAANGPGLGLTWTSRTFNDASWRSGATGWGYDQASTYRSLIETDLFAEMYNTTTTAYLRVPFEVDDPLSINTLMLRMKYDDGFVAYLNGQRVEDIHAPVEAAWDDNASDVNPDSLAVVYEEFDITDFKGALVAGTNVLAIQGLNVSSGSSDFLILPEITATVAGEVEPKLGFFKTPTPGAANETPPTDGFIADVQFSVDHGYYDAPFDVTITTATADATIRYTTDGTEPTPANGITYSGPIHVTATTVLRAAAFKPDFEPSDPGSRTYLFLNDVIRQSPNGAPPPGWPSNWGGNVVNYGMDQGVVNANLGTIINDMKAIPSMSIVMDLDDLFGPDGIYANPGGEGSNWEKETSLELINPDGSEGFQVNAGLRIRGGFSRSESNPKHAFRLFFRREYGDGKLNYPLFGDEGADEFDSVDLRTDQNYSWSFGNDSRHTAIRDVFSRDTQRDMGQPYTRSRYYHLYINGQYWGMYQSQERAEASYGETYLGGEKDNYDVVKAEAGPYQTQATDGNLDAFFRFWQGANAIAATPTEAGRAALYQQLLGNNPDGTRNPNYEVLLDAENLIDYMLVIVYGGNLDAPISNFLGNTAVNNWFGMRERTGASGGWKFFAHDSEHTLLNVAENRMGPYSAGSSFAYANPQWIWQQLWTSEDFRLAVADRVQEHFFNGGALTREAATARFQSRAAEIDRAIVGEAARWGNSGLNRQTWLNAVQFVTNNIFPTRGNVVLDQLNSKGLVSTLPPPSLTSYGGDVDPGFELGITSQTDAYYTTDGSDPRLPDGSVNPAATLIPSGSDILLYDALHPAKYFVPTGSNGGSSLGTTWTTIPFNDAAWTSGTVGVGYDLLGDYDGVYATDLEQAMLNVNASVYLRTEFNVANPVDLNGLNLRVKYDDGFIVFLNGQRVASRNAPPLRFGYNSLATAEHPDAEALEFESLSLSNFKHLLVPGKNVLAFQPMNRAVNNDDFLFVPELFTFGSPGAAELTLHESTIVRARAAIGNQWSAEVIGDFRLPSALRVTEIMYNPPAPPAGSPFVGSDFEFIELQNIGTTTLDLAGYNLGGGIEFEFGDISVAPGAYVVVVNNQAAFESRYGANLPVAGEFVGNLSNNGESVFLNATLTALVQDFAYSNTWYATTDGEGLSLTVVNPAGPLENWDVAAGWKVSSRAGGTPGASDAPIVVGDTNGDGEVNVVDLNNVRNNFGASGPGVVGDTNGDGEVSVVDLNNVRNNFGASAPAPLIERRVTRAQVLDSALESWASGEERVALPAAQSSGLADDSLRVWDELLWQFVVRDDRSATQLKGRGKR
ncbi:MAG: lamin tail domain-containing protein [Planctomycetia bacterium]|nr:lamin tail domain-containing protein [Planctomycetia bacterium]